MSTMDETYRGAWQAAMRNDTRGNAVFSMLNSMEDSGVAASSRFAMPNQPTTGDTVDVGADVYEFVTASGAVADDANIAVAIGADAGETRDNWIAAVNATYEPNEHPNITNVATTGPALANGTEALFADEVGTDVRLRNADEAGGTVEGGSPDILLAEAVTDPADVWKEGNVNMNTLAGRAGIVRQHTLAELVVTAAMITTGDVRVDVPFTPTRFMVEVYTSAGVQRDAGTDSFAIASDGVVITLGGGAAPDIQATDVVRLLIVE